MSNSKIIIAIDGHSSCGKSTFAKMIAKEIQYVYIDTGAMYRAVALYCINNDLYIKGSLDKEQLIQSLPDIEIRFGFNASMGVSETILNGENVETEIRKEKVSALVSEVSSVKEVRVKLVQLQQEMGKQKGVVIDGRDIGTVVFPNAEIKLFMTANSRVRALRRYDELKAKGDDVVLDDVEASIIERDKKDSSRKESPLVQAEDAVVLDNSEMKIEDQMVWFKDLFKKFL